MSILVRSGCAALFVFTVTASQLLAQVPAESTTRFQGMTVRFAGVERARDWIGRPDAFVNRLSEFDRALRLNSNEPVDQKQFLAHAVQQVEAWSTSDIEKLTNIIGKVDALVRQWNLHFSLPDEIVLIKTTGHEEAGPGAPYTRGAGIVMPGDVVANGDEPFLERLFLHELFHVLSRHRPEIRAPLYAIIGFQSCGEIEYPDSLSKRKITNPDAYHFDAFVEIDMDGEAKKVLPLTLAASSQIRPGGVMGNVTIEFLEVEIVDGTTRAKMVDGKPVLHPLPSVLSAYLAKIGGNTNYFIHPEEIMADNFSMAVTGRQNAPNPEILEGVRKQFAKVDR